MLANDSDSDGDSLTVTSVGTPAHGGTVANADGTITYTPAANYTGADSFAYTIGDGQDGSATATVNVTVTAGNDAPVAVNDAATMAEDTSVSIAVLANDTDLDGDILSVTGVGAAAHGSTAVNADGTITYTPAPGFNGSDAFTYTVGDGQGGSATAAVSVTVTPVNDAPVAVNDAATTAEETAVTIAVLANDTDVDGDTVTLTSVGTPIVTTVSGTIADGATIQIAGAAFGSKPMAAPLRFDDFERGTDDALLNGWSIHPAGTTPTFSTMVTRPNSNVSARSNFVDGQWNSAFGIANTPLPRIYLDGWSTTSTRRRRTRATTSRSGSPRPTTTSRISTT